MPSRGSDAWFDKVPLRFGGYTEAQFREGGFRVVPPATVRDGRVHRPQRRADAVLRQHRRLRGRGHDGGHLGHGRLVRADRQERPSVRRRRHRRRARAAAGQPDDHRGQLLHRRALRRSSKASSSRRTRCISMGVFIGQSTKIYDRATGEVHYGRVPSGSVVVPGSLPSADGKLLARLRRHRQARGRRRRARRRRSTSCCGPDAEPQRRDRSPA